MPAPTITVCARVGRSATRSMMPHRVARATPGLRGRQPSRALTSATTSAWRGRDGQPSGDRGGGGDLRAPPPSPVARAVPPPNFVFILTADARPVDALLP